MSSASKGLDSKPFAETATVYPIEYGYEALGFDSGSQTTLVSVLARCKPFTTRRLAALGPYTCRWFGAMCPSYARPDVSD